METKINLKRYNVFPIVDEITQNAFKYHNENLSKSVLPVTVKELEQSDLILPKTYSEGMVLVQHPYVPNKLLDINVSKNEIILEKMQHVTDILNLLGAKKTELHATLSQREFRKVSGKGEVKVIKAFSLKGKFLLKEQIKEYSKLSTSITNDSEWNQNIYEQAVDKAKEYGLDGDTQIKTLLDLRNPQGRPIGHYDLNIELSSDYNKILDAYASLDINSKTGVNIFSIKGNIKSQYKYKDTVMIKQKVDFVQI